MKTKLSILLSVVICRFVLAAPAPAVPGIISHQGKITVSGTNYTGSGLFKFALVNAAGTTTYWSNDGTSTGGSEPTTAVSLTVARGVFSVNLGDTSVANMTQSIPASVFANSGVYLRVWFDDGVNGSQLLSPDRQITSVGYAFRAGSAATYNETDPVFSASVASGIQASDTNAWNAKVDGSGTANSIAKFTSGSTIGNSVITESSGKIGIGTNTPSQTLEVNGTIKSSTGGFAFPDGSVQTTAATNTASSGGGSSPTLLVQAFLNSTVALAPSAETQINFDDLVTDVGSCYSGGAFVAPSTGLYTVQFNGVSLSTPAATRRGVIRKGGNEFFSGGNCSGNTSIVPTATAPVTYTGPLTQGDSLTFFIAINNATGAVATNGPSTAATSLTVIKW
jgi:hypothetical protein